MAALVQAGKKREENKFPTNKAVIIKYFIYFKFI